VIPSVAVPVSFSSLIPASTQHSKFSTKSPRSVQRERERREAILDPQSDWLKPWFEKFQENIEKQPIEPRRDVPLAHCRSMRTPRARRAHVATTRDTGGGGDGGDSGDGGGGECPPSLRFLSEAGFDSEFIGRPSFQYLARILPDLVEKTPPRYWGRP